MTAAEQSRTRAEQPKYEGDHEYRVQVLAVWKAITWLSFPAVFALMAWFGVGEWIADWAKHGFLKERPWGSALSPLMWAAVATVFAVGAYSTIIKWTWDAWDRDVKYTPVTHSHDGDEAR